MQLGKIKLGVFLCAAATVVASAGEKMSYVQWCEGWTLQCPSTPAEDVPVQGAPWTPSQWSSALKSLQALADSPSRLVIRRAELEDPALKQLAGVLKQDAALDKLKSHLDAAKFTQAGFGAGRLATGALTVDFSGETELQKKSSLRVKTANRVRLEVEDGNLRVAGISLADATGAKASSLEAMTVSEANRLSWGGSALEVSGVPIKRFLEDVLGIDLELPSPDTKPDVAALLKVISPLKDWLLKGERKIALNEDTFRRLSDSLPDLAEGDDKATLAYMLSHLTGLRAGQTRAGRLIEATVDDKITCSAGNKAQMMLAREFGVKSITKLSETSVSVTVYGIDARPKMGPIKPLIHLSRIDIEPTRIVVKNVPILGQWAMSFEELSQDKLSCPGW